MDPEGIPNDGVAHMDPENILNNDFEAAFAVVVPLQRNELTRATKSIQSSRGPAIAVNGLSANNIVADDNITEVTSLRPSKPRHITSVPPSALDTSELENLMPENATPASHGPAPTAEVKRKQKKHTKGTRKASKLRHTFREQTKDQDGMEDASNGNAIRPYEDGVTTLHRRRPASKTRISDRSASQENPMALEQSKDGSLLLDIANDLRGLIKIGLKTAPKLSRSLYRPCRWVLVGYVLWLIITYLWVSAHRFATTALAPICSNPIVGSRISFCAELLKLSDRPVNASKVAASQEELVVVMDQVGQNYDLARDMWGHVFAIQDLEIRVEISNLPRREELRKELDLLIQYTKKTAKSLSRFTAKAGRAIDTIQTMDEYAVKALEGIVERQRNLPALLDRVILVISPFAAFGPANAGYTEEQVKQVFITTANEIADEVSLLLKGTFDLNLDFGLIQETLDRIYRLAMNETGDLPRMDILGELWARLAHADDYEELRSHQSLLTDMTQIYESSLYMVKETTAALNRIEAECGEFRNDFAKSRLILKGHPLEGIIALFRKAGQRLEAGHKEFQRIENGERPRTKIEIRKTVTKGATLVTTRTRA